MKKVDNRPSAPTKISNCPICGHIPQRHKPRPEDPDSLEIYEYDPHCPLFFAGPMRPPQWNNLMAAIRSANLKQGLRSRLPWKKKIVSQENKNVGG